MISSLTRALGKKEQLPLVHKLSGIVRTILPSALLEHPTRVELPSQVSQTFYISNYPHIAHTGWLSTLLQFTANTDVTFHISPIAPERALGQLSRKITEMESTRRSMLRSGRIVGSELTDPLDSAVTLKTNMLRGQEKLFGIGLYITLHARNQEALQKSALHLETALGSRLFYSKSADYRQLAGYKSSLPIAHDYLQHPHDFDSLSAATTFPFASNEVIDPDGVLYGINETSNSLVIIDRFCLPNANAITIAQSGAGKSYASKIEILRHLLMDTQVFVIDPEDEYVDLARSIDGQTISITPTSGQSINPFALPHTAARQEIHQHIEDCMSLLSVMAGFMSVEERSQVDGALSRLFKTTKRSVKFDQVVASFRKTEHLDGLIDRLEPYISGSLKGLFATSKTLSLDAPLTVFSLKHLPPSLKPVVTMMIATAIQKHISASLRRRLLVIDEGWLLLEHEDSAKFIASLTRRARKYYLGVHIITQQVADFLDNSYGRSIASQSSLRILLKQDTTTIEQVAAAFRLSEYEKESVLTANRGEALIIAGTKHVKVKIVASAKEHPLLTTDPQEV
jgi:conjugal transfer ATP-binding protein TraC